MLFLSRTVSGGWFPGFMVSKGTKTLSKEGGVGFGGEGTGGKVAGEGELTLTDPTGRVEGLGSTPNDNRLSAVEAATTCC